MPKKKSKRKAQKKQPEQVKVDDAQLAESLRETMASTISQLEQIKCGQWIAQVERAAKSRLDHSYGTDRERELARIVLYLCQQLRFRLEHVLYAVGQKPNRVESASTDDPSIPRLSGDVVEQVLSINAEQWAENVFDTINEASNVAFEIGMLAKEMNLAVPADFAIDPNNEANGRCIYWRKWWIALTHTQAAILKAVGEHNQVDAFAVADFVWPNQRNRTKATVSNKLSRHITPLNEALLRNEPPIQLQLHVRWPYVEVESV